MLYRILAVALLYGYLEIIILINGALVFLMNANFKYLCIAIIFELSLNSILTDQ